MSTAIPACDAILLAAGSGRRLGLPKALLELQGIWMLPRLVEVLRAGGCRSVHVVVRLEDVSILEARGGIPGAQIRINPDPDAGRTGSVLEGLESLGDSGLGDALLIHSCDIPLLSAEAVHQLIRAWMVEAKRETLAARLVTPGGKGGHPLLLGRDRIHELQALTPERPLRDILHEDPDKVLSVVRRGDPGPFLDVDTPEQLELLESLL
ncbi:MAG: nucleotidyltransferase family protein [Planctomycetota bacterium]